MRRYPVIPGRVSIVMMTLGFIGSLSSQSAPAPSNFILLAIFFPAMIYLKP